MGCLIQPMTLRQSSASLSCQDTTTCVCSSEGPSQKVTRPVLNSAAACDAWTCAGRQAAACWVRAQVSPEERGERCPSLVLRNVGALQRADLRTSLLTPALLRRLGHATSLRTLELELPDALCAAGPVWPRPHRGYHDFEA